MPLPLNPQQLKSAAQAAGVTVSAMAVALGLITTGEGYRGYGYLDVVGIPTDCWGHTGKDVVVGKPVPLAVCQTKLAKDVVSHTREVVACIKVKVPDDSMGAFIDFGYNIGGYKFCRSTVLRRLNAGDLKAACAGISGWVFAGKPPRRIQGLVNRRAKERARCEKGLSHG